VQRSYKSIVILLFSLMVIASGCNLISSEDEGDANEDATDESGDLVADNAAAADDSRPTVVINSPVDGSTVQANSEVLIYSVARDAIGVTRVELRVDGNLINTVQSPNSDGQTELSVLQTWETGNASTATVEVVAYRGAIASEPQQISLTIQESINEQQSTALIPTVVAPVVTADVTCRVRVNVSALTIFEGAGTSTNAVTTVSLGAVIPLTGRTADNSWWQTAQGWLQSVYTTRFGNCSNLQVTGEVAIVPSATPSNTPTATNTAEPTIDPTLCRVQVLTENLAARTAPDVDSSIIVNLPLNSQWIVFQRTDNGSWWQINADGVLGWLPSTEIAIRGECSSVLTITSTPSPNAFPVISDIADQTLEITESRAINFTATDADNDSLSLTVASNNASVVSANLSDTNTVTIVGVDAGVTTVTVTANDGNGGQANAVFIVTVNAPPNDPPVVAPLLNQNLTLGDSITIDLNVMDPNDDDVTISATSSNAGIVFAAPDIDGNITLQALSVGDVAVTVTVDDGNGGQANTSFAVSAQAPESTEEAIVEPEQTQGVAEATEPAPESTEVVTEPAPESTEVVTEPAPESTEVATEPAPESTEVVTEPAPESTEVVTEPAPESTEVVAEPAPESTEVADVPNSSPMIAPVVPQTVTVGETLTVVLDITDPDGDDVTITSAESGATTIATLAILSNTEVNVIGEDVGQVNIQVVVDDGNGGSANTIFIVEVIAPEEIDTPPVVDPIVNQTIEVGESLTIPVNATDPEGFNPFLSEVASAADTIATAESDGEGNILVVGVAEGETTITATISDGSLETAITFIVTVEPEPLPPPNQLPTVEPIADITLSFNEERTVPVVATDPEGFNVFFAEVTSAADTIATAESDGEGNIFVTAVSPGQSVITVVVDDGNGGQVETSFTVTVEAMPTGTPNAAPVVDPVAEQVITVGESITIDIIATDPEGFNIFLRTVTSTADTIATAESDGEGAVVLTGIAPGTTSVQVTVEDGFEGQTTIQFGVTVEDIPEESNLPPTVEAVPNQVLAFGEELSIPIVTSDPEGFNVFFANITSAADTIATAESDGEGNVILTGVAPGNTTVTVIVDDGNGGQASVSFTVEVLPPPEPTLNAPPVIEPVLEPTMQIGDRLNHPIVATDPEGFNVFIAEVTSAASTIVVAVGPDGDGNVILDAIAPGTAVITVVVDDGNGGQATTDFTVTVAPPPTPTPNMPPVVEQPIDQVLTVGQSVTVFLVASDPEGFNPFIDQIVSAADTIATAESDGEGNVSVTGVAPGATTIDVTVSDGNGGTTTVTFNVTVEAEPEPEPVNEPPSIDPVNNQSVSVNQFLPVVVTTSDPEGAAVTLSVSSDTEAIATVQVTEDGSGVTVFGVAEGQAVITIVATDDQGATATTAFQATVAAEAAPEQPEPTTIDLNTVPIIPAIEGSVLSTIQAVYNGADANRFIVIGGVPPTDLLANAADNGYDLSAAPELQGTLDAYLASPADDSVIANRGGVRSSNAAWGIGDLLNPANNAADCGDAANPVACAIAIQQPSVAVILLGYADMLNGTDPEQFGADLDTLLIQLSDANVIPVLVTIAGDNADAYNQIIAQRAQTLNLPLWNLWRGIPADLVDGNGALTSPGAGFNTQMSPENVEAFGTPRRNLQLLQVLTAIRNGVPLQ